MQFKNSLLSVELIDSRPPVTQSIDMCDLFTSHGPSQLLIWRYRHFSSFCINIYKISDIKLRKFPELYDKDS